LREWREASVTVSLRDHPMMGLVSDMTANVERSAALLLEMMAGYDAARLYEIMERERVGDELTRDLLTYVEAESLATDALAHVDIRELAGVLEDTLDAVAAAADGLRLYHLSDSFPEVRELTQKVARGTGLVRQALALSDSRGDVRSTWLQLTRLEDEGEACAAAARTRLSDGQGASVSRWKDIVDLLEDALHGCQHGAAILVAAALQPV
jgi:uncharacterized protein Yka (UPF0111/DUF47 family)